MAVPKRKTSLAKSKSRRSHNTVKAVCLVTCERCQRPRRPHRVCSKCGYYGKEAILTRDDD